MTQEEAHGDLSCGCPPAVPSRTLSPTEVCVGGNLAGLHLSLSLEWREVAMLASPRPHPWQGDLELSPKTLKMCPPPTPQCNPAWRGLQRVSVYPG